MNANENESVGGALARRPSHLPITVGALRHLPHSADQYRLLRDRLRKNKALDVPEICALLESPEPYSPLPVSERLVQAIWYDQRLQKERLQTAGGRKLRVIAAGQWNLEAGPDFLRATIEIDGEPARTGDVEIHLVESDWKAHGHDSDRAYRNVILHVVLWKTSKGEPGTRSFPVLFLQDFLDSPLEDLYDSIDIEAYPYASEAHRGRCELNLRTLTEDQVGEILDSAGHERFLAKARKCDRWIQRAGPEQALYEGLMESLGYKANKEPFRKVAKSVPWSVIAGKPANVILAQFLGIAGFLPTLETTRWQPDARAYAKKLWDIWWKYRGELEDKLLRREDWKLSNIRPANHPQRRLAAMAILASKHRNLQSVIRDPKFEIKDPFWSFHFTLNGPKQKQPSELIGETRAREMAVNVMLPFRFAVANGVGDEEGKRNALEEFRKCSSLESNNVLRLAAHQLFGASQGVKKLLSTASRQQGLHQIFQDFCLNDRSACQQCLFPQLVANWRF
ncbi:MAG: DUF2851 family protein [Verrucomicrobiae bacterium]|nr:DUF2851 family protein [Verrucomicrobiae bacterium]